MNFPKWEYKSIHQSSVYAKDNKLNELGAEGWELVSVIHNYHYTYVFKRPVFL
jgi:hypothetical protein